MSRLKTTLLLSLLTILMVTMGSAVGGASGMVFAFIMALGMNFFSYRFSDKIVLKMYGAQDDPHAGYTSGDSPHVHLTGGALVKPFSTHPPMEERIRRLEAMR